MQVWVLFQPEISKCFDFPTVAQGFSLLFGGGAEVEEHGEDEIQYFYFFIG